MKLGDKIAELLKKNNGYISASEARECGIDNKSLQRGVNKGMLERVARGLYLGTQYFRDPYFIAQYRCPNGIFSHDTALFFHDLSDRVPLAITITIPSGGNSRLLTNKQFSFYYAKPDIWSFAREKKTTEFGNEIITYDVERTICDCLRNIDKLDRDLVLTAIKRYVKRDDRDFAKLFAYAELFKIRETVRNYMEVLL
ncbi:MAG: type IV toxin-antitoxin system AbiEi family antitoxin domain-containing protein [Clostridiales Family XIII bacterium]|jgi:predicted transcriptional regulator of viral defense system|nr:type IV toxin-antitoxin system AbiEi family antitoxin domain-containing protein [Clostridiales Family XIII bacterium]